MMFLFTPRLFAAVYLPALLLTLGVPAPQSSGPDVETPLERARAAIGPPLGVSEALEFRGQGTLMEIDGPAHLLVLPAGRYRLAVEASLPRTMAFDGEHVIDRDWNDTPSKLHFADREKALLQAWFTTGYWLNPEAGLEFEVFESEVHESGVPQVTIGFPGGFVKALVEFDPDSALPRSLLIPDLNGDSTTTLSDWRSVGERQAPFNIRTTANSGIPVHFIYDSVQQLDAAPDAPFVAIAAPPRGTHFASDVPARIELRRASTGHLLVPARVDGEDHGWFILDTGAGTMCISSDVAEQTAMIPLGHVKAHGVAGSTTTGFRRAKRFSFGPLTMEEPVFLEIDLAFLEPIFGVKIAGICGFEIFERALVEIDLGGGAVYVRDGLKDDSLAWKPLFLESRLPCMEARFEGEHEGLFRFDSGNSGNLEFDADTVGELDLLAGRELTEGSIGGVGGTRHVDRGQLEWVEFAGKRYSDLRVDFSRMGNTAQLSLVTDGVFGIGLLGESSILFDYRARRFAVREAAGR